MRISKWRKLKLYLQYRKNLLLNRDNLEQAGLRIDKLKRIYTVVNVPEALFEDVYGTRTSDINKVSQTYITDKVREISRLLNSIQLTELYKIYDTKKVDRYSYLVIIGYSLFDTKKLAITFWYRFIPSIIITTAAILLFLYM